MSVTDFECAIAKSQIARYIAGENLAPEVARHLESHIAVCSRCKQLLQEKKNSLEAIIEDKSSAAGRIEIEAPSDRIPMTRPTPATDGNLALKMDAMTPEPTPAPVAMSDSETISSTMSLREKLREQARSLSNRAEAEASTIEIPTVAPAFAHKDQTETIQLQIETPAEPKKKRGLSLSSFALYRTVPDEPKLTTENIKSARESMKSNPTNFAKPMLYMAGLCAVIGGMSFFIKNPTAMLGDKANAKPAAVSNEAKTASNKKKPGTSKVKRLPMKSEGTINAEFFVDPKATSKAPVKKASPAKPATAKPVTAKTAKKATAKKPTLKKSAITVEPTVKTIKRPTTRVKATTPKSTVRHSSTHKPSVATPKAPKQNEVKVYAPDAQ